jgi:predicted acylesterase/phospholipase RssA
MNGLLLEIGFLKRLRRSELWPRIGWYFGSSAGAVNSCMAALDRLEELEEFVLELKPEDTFRANRLWRLPLLGTHDYVLPRTVAARFGDSVEMARALAKADAEVVVIVTDLTRWDEEVGDGETLTRRLFERAYSTRETQAEEMAQALFASSAISALVLPQQVGERVATDGGWVRNFPLGYAYEQPGVELIVAYKYEGQYPIIGLGAQLRRLASRLRRYSRLPPVRALMRELEGAAEREERGQPAHIVDTFSRLSRVTMIRNTEVEELVARWRDDSVQELARLRTELLELAAREGGPELAEEVEQSFGRARFPFRHDRHIPRITVSGTVGDVSLEPGFRNPRPWTVESKQVLIDAGFDALDEELRRQGHS